jgi:hypothetical protein
MNAMNAHARQVEPELMERELPVADTATMLAITRAEIDGQIATARAFPRSNTGFIREATELVTLNADMAEACIYALPRDGKTVAGPSARFAEVIQHAFGNNRGGARVVAEEGDFIVAQGVYHDLEKNVQVTMEVRRRITDKHGRKFKADMIGVTGNAAASIAHRNAVLKGIPKALWLPIYEAARHVAVGDVTTLVDRRTKALAWFQNVNVTPEQVCAKLGVEGPDDIGLPELEILTGLRTAIRDGSVTPEDAFKPDTESNVKAATNVASMGEVAAKVAAKRKDKKPPAEMNPATGEVPGPEAATDGAPTIDPKKLRGRIFIAESLEEIDEAASDISLLPDGDEKHEINELYLKRRAEIEAR